MKLKLNEALFDRIVASILKGPNKATTKFLQKQAKSDPELRAKIEKAVELTKKLDISNQEVLDLLYDKYKNTKYAEFFPKR